MKETYRCGLCGSIRVPQDMIPCGQECIFGDEGIGPICLECVVQKMNVRSLDQVDKMCQFLDIPFDPDRWMKIYRQYDDAKLIICDYIGQVRGQEYTENTWKEFDLLWEKARETQSVLVKLPELTKDLLVYLKRKWGTYDDFNVEDYMKMESYEKNTLNYYNFRDEARRDMIRKLALVSVLIDKKLAAGDTREVSTLIGSYQSLMKESGIQNAVQNDTETIESLGELMSFLEEHGWLMDYRVTESRDIVDATIRNFQQYVQALVSGAGEEVTQMYNSRLMEEQSGTEITEEEIEAMFETQEATNDLVEDEALSEEELIDMFKEISNSYEK